MVSHHLRTGTARKWPARLLHEESPPSPCAVSQAHRGRKEPRERSRGSHLSEPLPRSWPHGEPTVPGNDLQSQDKAGLLSRVDDSSVSCRDTGLSDAARGPSLVTPWSPRPAHRRLTLNNSTKTLLQKGVSAASCVWPCNKGPHGARTWVRPQATLDRQEEDHARSPARLQPARIQVSTRSESMLAPPPTRSLSEAG